MIGILHIASVDTLRTVQRNVRAALTTPAATRIVNGLLQVDGADGDSYVIRATGNGPAVLIAYGDGARPGRVRLTGLRCTADGLPLGKAATVLADRRARTALEAVPA